LPPNGPTSDRDASSPQVDALGPRPGWFAISVTLLHGYYYPIMDGQGNIVYVDDARYVYFQHFRPVARAGYSIHIYHIGLEEADRVRQELGLPVLGGRRTEPPRN
jgi:hypothetical protein